MKKSLLFILILFFVSLAVFARSDFGVMSSAEHSSLFPMETYEFQILPFNLTINNTPTGINTDPICRIELYIRNSTVTDINDKADWNEYLFVESDYNKIVWNTTIDCIPVDNFDSFFFYAQADETFADYLSQWVLWTDAFISGKTFDVLIKNDSLAPRLINWTGKNEGIFVKNNDTIPFDFFMQYEENESGLNKSRSKFKYDYHSGCGWTFANCNLSLACNDGYCNTSGIFNNDTTRYIGFSFSLFDLASNSNSTENFDGTNWGSTQNLNFIYLDNEKPQVNLSLPNDRNITNNTTVIFSFDVDDDSFSANNGGDCTGKFNPELFCNLTLNNRSYNYSNFSNGTQSFTNILNDSIYQWSITCQDKAGWQNISGTRTLIVDTTNPFVNITYPLENQYVTGNIIWINGTIIDENKKNNTPQINESDFNLSYYDNSTGKFSFCNITTLTDGNYTIKINFTDDAGNDNESIRHFVIDTTPPNVALISPTDGSNTTNTSITFVYNVTDNLAPDLNCILYLDGAANQTGTGINNVGGNFTVNITSSGQNITWSVTCNDGVNDGSSDNYFLYVDNNINAIFNPVGPTVSTTSWTITMSFNEFVDINNATYDGNSINLSTTDNHTFTYGASGTDGDAYIIIINVTDLFGNSDSFNKSYTVSIGGGGPGGGSGSGSSCTDQCSLDEQECFNETHYRTCGDYDADSCYEWSQPISCEYGCMDGSCMPCIPDWQCTDWSDCINGTQTRSCEDKNNCGTEEGRPAEEQTCETAGSEGDGTGGSEGSEPPSGPGIIAGAIGVLKKPAAIGTIVGIIAVVAALCLMTNFRKRKDQMIAKKVKDILVDKESTEP